MKGRIILIAVIVLAFAVSFVFQWYLTKNVGDDNLPRSGEPHRIISLSPSVTEIVFALGLGDDLVGDTVYCSYPPEAKEITKIGDALRFDQEAIRRLKPDLAIVRDENSDAIDMLKRMGIRTAAVDNRTLDGILESISAIGKACDVSEEAEGLRESLENGLQSIREKTSGLEKPRVMMSLGRIPGTGKIKDLYVVGDDDFYSTLIEIAGGENVFNDAVSPFPTVSTESILRANPDIIIDTVPFVEGIDVTNEEILEDWASLSEISAVKNDLVRVVRDDFIFIPGPRFLKTAEEFAKIIHPELDWD